MRRTLPLFILLLLAGCRTITVEQAPIALPDKPAELQVRFDDMPEDRGLFLSYDEYRKLEINIINLRHYIAQLEGIILGDYPFSSRKESDI